MDKVEYHQKLDELTGYVQNKKYADALPIVEEIDWRRVKSVRTLNMVADVYEMNKNYAAAKDILLIANSRSSIGRGVLYRLVELSLKLNQIDEAEKYFKEFNKTAQNDNSKCILQYKLYKAKNAPLDAQIAVLEEYREREYTEKWAYELAVLYSKAGDRKKCVEACDDLILWFSEGKYVVRAMELKMRYEHLTPSQQTLYDKQKNAYRRKMAVKSTLPYSAVVAPPILRTEPTAAQRAETPKPAAAAGTNAPKPEIPASIAAAAAATAAAVAAGRPTAPVHKAASASRTASGTAAHAAAADASIIGSTEAESTDAASLGRAKIADDENAEDADLRDAEDTEETEDKPKAKGGFFRSGEKKSRHSFFRMDEEENEDDEQDEERDAEADDEDEDDDFEPNAFDEALDSIANAGAGLKDKLSRGLKGVFGGRDEEQEKSFSTRIRHDDEDDEEDDDPDDFSAIAEEHEAQGLKVKELAEEDLSVNVTAPDGDGRKADRDARETARRESAPKEQEQINADDFNLEAFLSETMGSLSAEIASGDYESGEEPVSTGEIPELEEEELPVEEAQTVPETATEEAAAEVVAEEDAVEEEAAESDTAKEENAESDAAGEQAGNGENAENAEQPAEEKVTDAADASEEEPKKIIHYNEELEIPDPEPTPEEKKFHSHTIPLNVIGQNTVPISMEKILDEETPEERRIRFLNKAKPNRMSEDQRKIFTYFARIPGMDGQILEAINGVYEHAGERTSLHGNIAVMGAQGTGKSRLSKGLVIAMCHDLGLDAAKVARLNGEDLNEKDPAKVVSQMSGGFLMIEDISKMSDETVMKLNQAMEFRTDCMVLVAEDEKSNMRAFLKKFPQFAAKFEKVISIPVFTNDELVTFARTYATENGCKLDEMGILALYTLIGNNQTEEKPVTISQVKDMIDHAISKSSKGRHRRGSRKDKWIMLQEKDFDLQ
ncbi:MAG: hypothetical protein UHN88_08140 [Eubacterium sp.]|nr:hypothetical protein [Eubacterium sp.]